MKNPLKDDSLLIISMLYINPRLAYNYKFRTLKRFLYSNIKVLRLADSAISFP